MLLFIFWDWLCVRLNEWWGHKESAETNVRLYVWINSETQRRVEIESFGLILMITAQYFSSHTHSNNFRSHNVFWTVECAEGKLSFGIHTENAHAHELLPTKRLHFQDISPESIRFSCVPNPHHTLINSIDQTNQLYFVQVFFVYKSHLCW